jgi:hypothetical protein
MEDQFPPLLRRASACLRFGMSSPLIIMHVSALVERVRIAPDPARESAAQK